MKKSERINDMLRYLNDKKQFRLKDIMSRYSISKSTALRDIQSLEAIGMPLYATLGRNGHYNILANRLLSPIIFTVDEVYALYFSMQMLSAYQSTPFDLNIAQLKEKFASCISQERVEQLEKMQAVFRLGSYQTRSDCPFLPQILQMAVSERVCDICYQKGAQTKHYSVQFFDITSQYGQWYTTAYHFQSKRPVVFRCDKIHSLTPCDGYEPRPLAQLLATQKSMFRDSTATQFEVLVSAKGADLFYKEHYPSMELCRQDDSYCIRGFYNKGEERFIADYFIAYGQHILAIQPRQLQTIMLERLESIGHHIAAVGG